jgi:hypothetical protein
MRMKPRLLAPFVLFLCVGSQFCVGASSSQSADDGLRFLHQAQIKVRVAAAVENRSESVTVRAVTKAARATFSSPTLPQTGQRREMAVV